jgi:hypothetical protein
LPTQNNNCTAAKAWKRNATKDEEKLIPWEYMDCTTDENFADVAKFRS